jgi:hypothetical protein
MFDADEMKATHVGFERVEPSTDGLYEGPSAAAPLFVRDMSTVRPGFQRVPAFVARLPRNVTKTSLTPSRSFPTRFDASDSNAITRTKRLSFDMTAFVDAPFGAPPCSEFEIRYVEVVRALVTVAVSPSRALALTPPQARTAMAAGATR